MDVSLSESDTCATFGWFRMYRDLRRSRKVINLIQYQPDLYIAWTLLLQCTDNTGHLSTPWKILRRYPELGNEQELARKTAALVEARLLDVQEDGRLRMHKWDLYQTGSKKTAEAGTGGWFKMYRDLHESQKIMALVQDKPKQYIFWTLLLQCTNSTGHLPSTWHLLREFPEFGTATDLERDLAFLVEARLLDVQADGRLRMYRWDRYQSPSDTKGALHQRQHREREAAKQGRTLGKPGRPRKYPEPVQPAPVQPETAPVPVEVADEDDEAPYTGPEEFAEKFRKLAEEKTRKEIQNNYVRPLDREVDKEEKREEEGQMNADGEECLNLFIETYPQERMDLPTAAQSFVSLWGKPAPSPNGLNLKSAGIPNKQYFLETVLPSIKAAKDSEQWAEDENGKRYIPNASTFLTGNNNPTKPNLGRQWLTKWKPSKVALERKRLSTKSSTGTDPMALYVSPAPVKQQQPIDFSKIELDPKKAAFIYERFGIKVKGAA